MTARTLTIRYPGGQLTTTIDARHSLSHYVRNYPHAGSLDAIHQHQAHAADKLATLQRVVAFMDRYDLLACTPRQCSLTALGLARVPTRAELLEQPAPSRSRGWDHVRYWRRAGEGAPLVVVTEPYRLDPGTLREYLELAERLDLEFQISSRFALWNPPKTTAVLWHRKGERWWEHRPKLAAA